MIEPFFKPIPPLGPGKLSPREKVCAQWRGINLVPLERARALNARSAADLMPKVLRTMRIDQRRSEAEVIKVWNSLLDPNITAHAQPVGLRRGTLFVSVDSSAWLSEIVRYRQRDILERLRHSFGPDLIVRISFRIG